VIPARKRALFNRIFVAYARSLLRGHFRAVRVQGLDHAAAALARGPVVFVANHTAWWDSIVLMWLSNYPFRQAGPSSGYAMMDARNLRRLTFFRSLGVFGVELSSAEDRAAVVDYAAGLLTEPGVNVWIFPQGAERPITEPLSFRAGAARIAHQAGAVVVPMSIRYEHGRHDKPTAYIVFGEPLTPVDGAEQDVAAQEQAVRQGLEHIEAEVRRAARREDSMPVALPGRKPFLGQLATRFLALFTGRR